MAIACLYCLTGIPCLITGPSRLCTVLAVLISLCAKPYGVRLETLSTESTLSKTIAQIAKVRRQTTRAPLRAPVLCPLSGDQVHFDISRVRGGVLAFSRILDNQEVLVVANTNTTQSFVGEVVVDMALNADHDKIERLFSNKAEPQDPSRVVAKAAGTVEIHAPNGTITNGPVLVVAVSLKPMEAQILRKAR